MSPKSIASFFNTIKLTRHNEFSHNLHSHSWHIQHFPFALGNLFQAQSLGVSHHINDLSYTPDNFQQISSIYLYPHTPARSLPPFPNQYHRSSSNGHIHKPLCFTTELQNIDNHVTARSSADQQELEIETGNRYSYRFYNL